MKIKLSFEASLKNGLLGRTQNSTFFSFDLKKTCISSQASLKNGPLGSHFFFPFFKTKTAKLSSRRGERPKMGIRTFAENHDLSACENSKLSSRVGEKPIFASFTSCEILHFFCADFLKIQFFHGFLMIFSAQRVQKWPRSASGRLPGSWEASGKLLGGSWEPPGRGLGELWDTLGTTLGLFWLHLASRSARKFDSNLLGSSWEAPGRLLGGLWEHFRNHFGCILATFWFSIGQETRRMEAYSMQQGGLHRLRWICVGFRVCGNGTCID